MKEFIVIGKTDLYHVNQLTIIKGNKYKAYHSIILIDPVKMKPTESGYLVVCEDGITRKFSATDSIKNFYTIEQWRENQLNGIGI